MSGDADSDFMTQPGRHQRFEDPGIDTDESYALLEYPLIASSPQAERGEQGSDARPVQQGAELDPETAPEPRAEPPLPLTDGESADPRLPVSSPITGPLPFDLRALERGVDRFFAQVESVGEDLAGARFLPDLAPWLATAAATVVAFELARWRMAKQRNLSSPFSVGG
jgi:hypothetical protein